MATDKNIGVDYNSPNQDTLRIANNVIDNLIDNLFKDNVGEAEIISLFTNIFKRVDDAKNIRQRVSSFISQRDYAVRALAELGLTSEDIATALSLEGGLVLTIIRGITHS